MTDVKARQTKTDRQRAQEAVDVLTRRAKRQYADVEKHEKAAKAARAAHSETTALLEHAKGHPALRGLTPPASTTGTLTNPTS